MPINLGCSWNDSLVVKAFEHTAAALTMLGGNVGLSPVINMCGGLLAGAFHRSLAATLGR